MALADEDAPSQLITVDPGENVTTWIENWVHGDVTAYISEDLGDNSTHV